MALTFKSRFGKSHPTVPLGSRARITASYADTAKVEGLNIDLADLRTLVEAVSDWPSTAQVDVRRGIPRDPYRGPREQTIGIVITARETE